MIRSPGIDGNTAGASKI